MCVCGGGALKVVVVVVVVGSFASRVFIFSHFESQNFSFVRDAFDEGTKEA